MRSEVDRPSHSVVQVLKLWNLTAQLFSTRISRGSEVSNEPDRTQLISLINFITVPFKLKPPTDKASACPEALMTKFKNEFAQLFKGITGFRLSLTDRFLMKVISMSI